LRTTGNIGSEDRGSLIIGASGSEGDNAGHHCDCKKAAFLMW
jgi:hypothetical protein